MDEFLDLDYDFREVMGYLDDIQYKLEMILADRSDSDTERMRFQILLEKLETSREPLSYIIDDIAKEVEIAKDEQDQWGQMADGLSY